MELGYEMKILSVLLVRMNELCVFDFAILDRNKENEIRKFIILIYMCFFYIK